MVRKSSLNSVTYDNMLDQDAILMPMPLVSELIVAKLNSKLFKIHILKSFTGFMVNPSDKRVFIDLMKGTNAEYKSFLYGIIVNYKSKKASEYPFVFATFWLWWKTGKFPPYKLLRKIRDQQPVKADFIKYKAIADKVLSAHNVVTSKIEVKTEPPPPPPKERVTAPKGYSDKTIKFYTMKKFIQDPKIKKLIALLEKNIPDGTPAKQQFYDALKKGDKKYFIKKLESQQEPVPQTSSVDATKPSENKTIQQTNMEKPAEQAAQDTKIVSSSLGGSTGAKLVEIDGKKYVQKYGASTKHVLNEFLVNQIYSHIGVDVPSPQLKKDNNNKPYQLTDYIDGVQLGKLSLDEFDKIAAQLRGTFVIDAWLGNWDVIGANYDNIVVKNGKAYRIDNGGAGMFKATGGSKSLTDWVDELDNMRDNSINKTCSKVFGALSWDDIKDQFIKYKPKMLEILNLNLPPILKSKLQNRLDYLQKVLVDNDYESVPYVSKNEIAHISSYDPVKLRNHKEFAKLISWYEYRSNSKVETKADLVKMLEYINSIKKGDLEYENQVADKMPDGFSFNKTHADDDVVLAMYEYNKEVPKEVKKSVSKYTGTDYYTINNRLRTSSIKKFDDETVKDIVHIDNYLKYAPKVYGYVTRGCKDTAGFRNFLEDKLKTGAAFPLRGYTSTTTYSDPQFGGLRLLLSIKSGVSVKDLSSHSSENEVLLPRNTVFVCKPIPSSHNQYDYYLEEV